MTEVCAERGYGDTSVAEIVKRAGVSSVTFYQQFAEKRECMLVAHQQLLARLLETLDRAGESETGRGLRVTIRTALSLLAADPPSARLLTVEILAAGPEGAKRHDVAVEALVSRLWPANDPPPPAGAWVLVAGMLALIGKRVMGGEADRLSELEDELVALAVPGA